MKLIIQIPCLNEAGTLATTLRELPRVLPGISSIEWLVINDGSTDGTRYIAAEGGVNHIIDLPQNRGLANAFAVGLEACLRLGADIIVNTDADNQYCAEDIKLLVEPILARRADFVIGTRPINDICHFSPIKKFLQKFGSFCVRIVSNTEIQDVTSGFRAYSRSAAIRINIFGHYSHTIETILQLKQKNMMVESVPVRVNAYLRPSRLMKSMPSYIFNSLVTILRVFVIYNPLKFFSMLGSLFLSVGLLFCARFLYFYLYGYGQGHVQSLILASILLLVGVMGFMLGLLAELLSVNRRLLEDLQARAKRAELDSKPPASV